jgi:excisionase family DNA binding protein
MPQNSVNIAKDVFTTFDVAKICNANITSIKNWIERGKLDAFRTPGGHYRIKKQILRDFLDLYEMPNPFDALTKKSIVVLNNDPGVIDLIKNIVGEETEVVGTTSPISAAILLGDTKPDCVVIDLSLANSFELVEKIRAYDTLTGTSIISYTEKGAELGSGAKADHVDKFALPSEGVDHLCQLIREEMR